MPTPVPPHENAEKGSEAMAAETSRRMRTAAAAASRLLLLAVLLSSATPLCSGARYVVGGRYFWNPGVNYTQWAESKHFYVGDWLEFDYKKGYYDVVQVNQMDFERCDTGHPILSFSRGRSFVLQLNSTGAYYFTASGGHCWNQMKLAIDVETAPPPPAPAPLPSSLTPASGLGAGLFRGFWTAVLLCFICFHVSWV